MAERDDTPETPTAGPCSPCKGSGTVISGLGGEQREISCPWCGGTGVREPGRDAQEAAAAARAAD